MCAKSVKSPANPALSHVLPVTVTALDVDALATATGRVVCFVGEEGALDAVGRRLNRLTKGGLGRLIASPAFGKLKGGEAMDMAFPAGMAADALQVMRLDRRADEAASRKAGVTIAKGLAEGQDVLIAANAFKRPQDIVLGLKLRAYKFERHLTKKTGAPGAVTMAIKAPETVDVAAADAIAQGVFFTRDLVSEPANVLTTVEFASRLAELSDLGVKVEVLDEPELEKLGMRCLLAVGQGSRAPSKVVVMEWKGSEVEAPLALVGKGVVFDTGGISIKPAPGMEEMTMDMGGAGTVAGVMKTLALRGAKAHVVGLVGLVENMPDGNAMRPGDIVASMKGDTVEIQNTDAEGRLVLCDVLWYAQERFKPAAMIDMATLTGAIIIGLGHENAGVFSNDDALCDAFLKSAKSEGEGAWRMPLSPAYDALLKTPLADMKNIGGRPAGASTAAQFLQRFVKDETPWIHLDIAGVALVGADTTYAGRGATGWGVMALNRLVADRFEAVEAVKAD